MPSSADCSPGRQTVSAQAAVDHAAGLVATGDVAADGSAARPYDPPVLGPRGLLVVMTGEELGQYETIARHQVAREARWQRLLWGGAVVAVPVGLWALARGWQSGFGGTAFGLLGLAWLMGYVPYRVSKARQMWQSHLDAVAAERQRRLADGPPVG